MAEYDQVLLVLNCAYPIDMLMFVMDNNSNPHEIILSKSQSTKSVIKILYTLLNDRKKVKIIAQGNSICQAVSICEILKNKMTKKNENSPKLYQKTEIYHSISMINDMNKKNNPFISILLYIL
ncbi:hypothetical protein MXB_626 [Myxobolus squamalis]|nr:hypothetical protein MXB_626 [Myxobolus squamalis]